MKKFIILTAAVMFTSLFSQAQNADPELDFIKTSYSQDKKTIVDQYMGLDVQEGAKFWSIYGAYEAQREKLAVERLNTVTEYVSQASSLTPELADKIAVASLANSTSLAKLNQEYYGKMKKAIGSIKAAKFMQLEIYLQTQWRGYIQENIPLISDLEKTQAQKN